MFGSFFVFRMFGSVSMFNLRNDVFAVQADDVFAVQAYFKLNSIGICICVDL